MYSPTDFLGRTIKAGDLLIYPVRRGSRMWLNKITVTKAEESTIIGNSPEERQVKLTNLFNTIVASAF